MKIERTKNATRNIVFGVILRIYQMLVPFVMRTAMIYLLGVNYLGLNNLFVSVLQVLNLAELGVGTAMVYNMYKPIVENDSKKICALMRLYKIYYRIIGCVVLIGGLVVLPFLPYLIKRDLPEDVNLYVLYLLNLGATVLTYWLFAYKNCLLNAHQRLDVCNKVMMATDTFKYILQLISLAVFKSYYLYVIAIIISQILTNLVTAYFTNKMYPKYHAHGKLDKKEVRSINHRILDLFTAKIGGVVFNSADTIVISSFIGLSMLAIYQNYYYIMSSIVSVIGIIMSSCTAGIGNSILVESEEKNYNDFKKCTFIIAGLSGFCSACLLCLMQPFMEIWVTKKLMLNIFAVVMFCIYYFVEEINAILNLYKDASGIWHQDRFRPLVVSLVNLVVNIILVNFTGIYGVLIASCFSRIFIGIPWILHNLFTTVFNRNAVEYIKKLFYYTFVTLVTCLVAYILCSFITGGGIGWFVVRIVICSAAAIVVLFLFYRKSDEYCQVMKMAKAHLPDKLKKYIDVLVK